MVEVFVKVHPTVFYLYRNIHGSERISLKNDPSLSRRVKMILETKPAQYRTTRFKNFKILVLQLHNFRIGDKRINIAHRSKIDDRMQYFLSRELMDYFDAIFLSSVAAYCSARNMEPGCQKMGIEDFMTRYNIDVDAINYQTLKKKWDRSDEKRILLNKVKKQHKSVTVLSPAIIQ